MANEVRSAAPTADETAILPKVVTAKVAAGL